MSEHEAQMRVAIRQAISSNQNVLAELLKLARLLDADRAADDLIARAAQPK
jgi:hypothetical protein